MTKLTLEKIETIKKLAKQGLPYKDIGEQVGIHKSTAYEHSKEFIPLESRLTQSICYASRSGSAMKCSRATGHGGVHMGNDKRGRLYYW